MARRMFDTKIVSSDPFVDMPASTQALYFHLGMHADDDGFVYPKQVMRSIGSNEDELKVLLTKKFIMPFESGVVVMKHWHVNNTLRRDRMRNTTHMNERATLKLDNSGVYHEIDNQDAALMRAKEGRKEGIKEGRNGSFLKEKRDPEMQKVGESLRKRGFIRPKE